MQTSKKNESHALLDPSIDERTCCFSTGKTLLVSVTEQCNQSCLHCMRSAVLGRVDALDLAVFGPKLSSALQSVDPKKVVISGGEPTLIPNLDDLIEFIRIEGPDHISLCTNALRIDATYATKLHRCGLTSATVGAEGVGSDYDFFRQSPGSFQRMMKGIEALSNVGILTTLNISLWDGVIGAAQEIARNINEEHLTSISVTSPMFAGRAIAHKDLFGALNENNVRIFLNELRQELSIPISYRRPSCDRSSCPSGRTVFSLKTGQELQGCLDAGSTNVLDL